MKQSIFLIFASAFLFSCSSTDDSNGGSGSETTYLSLKSGNYWVYNVTGADISGRDSLYIANDTTINSKSYTKFKTKVIPTGFFSGSLRNNGLKKSGDKLLLTGSAGLNFGETLPIDLQLTDFVTFKESASNGEQLDKVQGTIEQVFDGLPTTIKYSLKSIAGASLPQFQLPNGDSYTDVKSVKTILELKISVQLEVVPGFAQQVVILDTQDVVTSTQYFSKNIGVVYVDTNVSYTLEDLPVETEFQQSYHQNSKEILDIYKAD